jgi:hypothetical protein
MSPSPMQLVRLTSFAPKAASWWRRIRLVSRRPSIARRSSTATGGSSSTEIDLAAANTLSIGTNTGIVDADGAVLEVARAASLRCQPVLQPIPTRLGPAPRDRRAVMTRVEVDAKDGTLSARDRKPLQEAVV